MNGAVGFIGLGNIGAPMATRLLEWPGGLVVHDVRPEACDPYVERRERSLRRRRRRWPRRST